MTWATATTRHGERIKLNNALAFATLRSALSHRAEASPTIVTFESSSCRVDIGLAGDLGFVQGQPPNGDPPYRVTVGDSSAAGLVAFLLHGDHHTEIPARHMVPIGDAWAATATLLATGTYLPSIQWEEV